MNSTLIKLSRYCSNNILFKLATLLSYPINTDKDLDSNSYIRVELLNGTILGKFKRQTRLYVYELHYIIRQILTERNIDKPCIVMINGQQLSCLVKFAIRSDTSNDIYPNIISPTLSQIVQITGESIQLVFVDDFDEQYHRYRTTIYYGNNIYLQIRKNAVCAYWDDTMIINEEYILKFVEQKLGYEFANRMRANLESKSSGNKYKSPLTTNDKKRFKALYASVKNDMKMCLDKQKYTKTCIEMKYNKFITFVTYETLVKHRKESKNIDYAKRWDINSYVITDYVEHPLMFIPDPHV